MRFSLFIAFKNIYKNFLKLISCPNSVPYKQVHKIYWYWILYGKSFIGNTNKHKTRCFITQTLIINNNFNRCKQAFRRRKTFSTPRVVGGVFNTSNCACKSGTLQICLQTKRQLTACCKSWVNVWEKLHIEIIQFTIWITLDEVIN